MSRYTDLDQLLADLLPEITDVDQKAAVGRTLDAVSAFIDRYCRRAPDYFAASSETPSTKKIRGEGERYLRLPQHVTGSVEIAGLEDSSWYEAENGWVYLNPAGDIIGDYGAAAYGDPFSGVFYRARLYDVTARWGFEAIPLEIEQAARLLTQKIWETQRGVLGDITPSGYVVERSMPLYVRETLDLYRKREFER